MATASVQQFCLRWNNHQPNFISVFSSLLNSESLVDVTLAAEGKHLQAHKIVLSACSSYFQSLFTVNPCKHPIVILKDIKYTDLKIMVDFMYCGEVNVSQEQLPAVLKTAETLKVKGLAEMPEHNISLTNATGDKNVESSPSASPSILRRKRLRKSSTGSGSGSTEQTTTGGSEETVASGVASPSQQPQIKAEPNSENEGSLRHEPSTESEPGFISQESVDDESTSAVQHQSSTEEKNEGGLKSSNSMDDSSVPSTSSQQQFSSGWGSSSAQRERERLHLGKVNDPEDNSCGIVITPCKSQIRCASTSTSTEPMSPPPRSHSSPSCCHITPSPSPSRGRGRRTKDPQHSENFHNALEAVRSGGLGFCKAARLFGVNNRTLWLEYKRLGYPVTRRSLKTMSKANNDNDNKPSSSRMELSQSPWSPASAPATSSNIFDASFFFQNQFENYLPVIKSSTPSHQQPHEYPHSHHQPAPPVKTYTNTGTIMLATNNGSGNMNISSSGLSSSSPVSSTHSVSPHPPLPLAASQMHSHPPPPLPHPPPHMPTSSTNHPSSSTVDPPSTNTMGSKRGRLLMRQHRIKKENDMTQGFDCDEQLSPQPGASSSGGGATNCTTSSSIPRVIERQCSEPIQSSPNPSQSSPNLLSVPQPSYLVKQHSSPLLLSPCQPSSPSLHVHLVTPSSSSEPCTISSGRSREELRRTASSPQCSTILPTELESRSCHCPVLRPGPALGCNFCWNTIDGHGRILRRKTKYHCPECNTNLCIVPCFQEYHERHSSEGRVVVPLSSGSSNNTSTIVPTIMKTSSM